MAWIARDKTGRNPYRIFGRKPVKRIMVSYDGELMEGQETWTLDPKDQRGYGPLSNDEPTFIPAADCPIELEPGEGPIQVKISLAYQPDPRPFEGAGI